MQEQSAKKRDRHAGKLIRFWCNDFEYQRLQMLKQHSGLSMTDYIKLRAIYNHADPLIVMDTDDLNKAVFQFRKVGTNLNQLMHFMNTYGIEGYNHGLTKHCLDELIAAEDSINQILDETQKDIRAMKKREAYDRSKNEGRFIQASRRKREKISQ